MQGGLDNVIEQGVVVGRRVIEYIDGDGNEDVGRVPVAMASWAAASWSPKGLLGLGIREVRV